MPSAPRRHSPSPGRSRRSRRSRIRPQLYDHIRAAPVIGHKDELKQGDVTAAIAGAAKTLSAEYEWPFQSHASMVGGCSPGRCPAQTARTVWTGTQKPHYAQAGIAKLLGLPPEKMRVYLDPRPGQLRPERCRRRLNGRHGLSRAIGRPVRVQYMRDQGTGWDPKGPASVHRCQAASTPVATCRLPFRQQGVLPRRCGHQ